MPMICTTARIRRPSMDAVTLNTQPGGLKTVAQKTFKAPTPEDKPGARFAVEAATAKFTFQATLLRSLDGSGAAGQAPPISADDLREKVKAFVKDVFEKNGIEYKDLSPEEAQKQTAPGGDWSPEAVSKRILDFVKPFADGSPGREKLLRDAVEDGLKQAESAWGSKLPDIAYRTMDLVHQGLDQLFGTGASGEGKAPQGKAVDLTA
jgi:hypothetical protein